MQFFLVVDAPVQCCRALTVAIPQVQFLVLLMTCLSLCNDRCRVRQCIRRAGTAVVFEVVFVVAQRQIPWSRLSFDHGHSQLQYMMVDVPVMQMA